MKEKTHALITLFVIIFTIIFVLLMTGCTETQIRDVHTELAEVQGQVASIAEAVGSQTYGPDETLNLLEALQAGNVASSPWNPYAIPIGVGLSGIIAMLEALRRKEKGGRKYAEHELKNGNGNNGKW